MELTETEQAMLSLEVVEQINREWEMEMDHTHPGWRERREWDIPELAEQ